MIKVESLQEGAFMYMRFKADGEMFCRIRKGKYNEAEPHCRRILDIKERGMKADAPEVTKWLTHLVNNLLHQVGAGCVFLRTIEEVSKAAV